MPERYGDYAKGFLKLNPGWVVMDWTGGINFRLINQELFDNAVDGCEQSDLARYEILYQFGGVFIDTDMECKKSFEPLREVAFCGEQEPGRPCPAVIGAECGNPFILEVIRAFPEAFARNPTDRIARCFEPFSRRAVASSHIHVYTKEYFYPYHYTEKHKYFGFEDWPNSYAVHHWDGGWAA
jgi:mannosyltransferase OCH1-like enzyme